MDAPKLIAMITLPLLVSFCSPPVGNLCTAGPIILDPGFETRLTRSEKEQILTLDNSGRTICGWRSLS